MKSRPSLRARIESFLSRERNDPDRLARLVIFQVRLWRHCARRLKEQNVAAMSSALSFRTIFALVPMLVLAFLVLNAAGVLDDGQRSLRRVLDTSGLSHVVIYEMDEDEVPSEETLEEIEEGKLNIEGNGPQTPKEEQVEEQLETAKVQKREVNLADEIEKLVAHVEEKITLGRVGPFGVVLLIWTSLTLLTTMERCLNRIFGARRPRSAVRRTLFYWSAVTLGPLLLILAAYSGKTVMESVSSYGPQTGFEWLVKLSGWLQPVLVGVLLTAAVYKLMPNTHVRFRAALGGAIVAVPLWVIFRTAFSYYVTHFVSTGNLYGALGLVPLFLIWLNVSWWSFLFGASIANAAANIPDHYANPFGEEGDSDAPDLLAAAIAMAAYYRAGQGAVSNERLAVDLAVPTERANVLLDRLIELGLVCRAGDPDDVRFVLVRPADQVKVARILGLLDTESPEERAGRYTPEIAAPVARVLRHTAEEIGDFTLADALEKAVSAPSADRAPSPVT